MLPGEHLEAVAGGGVLGDVVLPAPPDDVRPGPGKDAHGVGVVAAAGDGLAYPMAYDAVVWQRGSLLSLIDAHAGPEAGRDREREAGRKAARRKAAIARGQDLSRITGAPVPLARITVLPRGPFIREPVCAGADPDLLFSGQPDDITAALAIGQGCPGRLPCSAGAVERGEVSGARGGADSGRGHVREESVA
jgi:hypothetical protein